METENGDGKWKRKILLVVFSLKKKQRRRNVTSLHFVWKRQ